MSIRFSLCLYRSFYVCRFPLCLFVSLYVHTVPSMSIRFLLCLYGSLHVYVVPPMSIWFPLCLYGSPYVHMEGGKVFSEHLVSILVSREPLSVGCSAGERRDFRETVTRLFK